MRPWQVTVLRFCSESFVDGERTTKDGTIRIDTPKTVQGMLALGWEPFAMGKDQYGYQCYAFRKQESDEILIPDEDA